MQNLAEKQNITNYSDLYSLTSLLKLHEEEKSAFHHNPLFQRMRSGGFMTPQQRDTFFEYYQEWSSQFQRMILLRSALCEDERFQEVFAQHLDEEYGHDKVLQKERNILNLKKDPLVQALCGWFPHKMLSSSPREQWVISNLCIESASVIIHNHAIPVFDPCNISEYYNMHENHNYHHATGRLDFLENLQEYEYKRLSVILKNTWDIMNALMARIDYLCFIDTPIKAPSLLSCGQPISLEDLRMRNEEYKNNFRKHPLFAHMQNGYFSYPQTKGRFFSYLHVWSTYFQRLMMLKTALLENHPFSDFFWQHFEEEYGHDKILQKEIGDMTTDKDICLEALCGWFVAQMVSFTPHEQIVLVHLCLEAASNVFQEHATPALDPAKQHEYLSLHEELDSSHEMVGYSFLDGLSSSDYQRLLLIQESSWEMFEALMQRITDLCVESESDKILQIKERL
ncbi:MAG: hypothetical protein F9K49_03820 [Caedimonadaceae bacterium]|nr:MAG: hypothetical protein F9K49_03820 [Caedimonadaceae bacterium]